MTVRMSEVLMLLACVAIPVLAGFGIGFITSKETGSEWYQDLKKPAWNPPSKVFGPVWGVLYALMGIAFWFAWKSSDHKVSYWFIAQLVVNLIWPVVFFKLRALWAAFAVISLLMILIIMTILDFYKKGSVLAAGLMIPYICWVMFASTLNFSIALNNRHLN